MMPIYVYRDEEGNKVEKNVSIDQRDNQPGLTRLMIYTGSVWSPTANGGHK